MVRESYIEAKLIKYARKLGWREYKLGTRNKVGLPDRMFLRKGRCLFIEFKSPNKTPRKIQQIMQQEIINEGFEVYNIDNIDYGVKLFNSIEVNMSKGIQDKVDTTLDEIIKLECLDETLKENLKVLFPLFKSSYNMLSILESLTDFNKNFEMSMKDFNNIINYAKSKF